MKHWLLGFALMVSFSVTEGMAQKKEDKVISYKSFPPIDTVNKDYTYYFQLNAQKTPTWSDYQKRVQHCLDSFYLGKYSVIKIDSTTNTYKVKLQVFMKSHGMLKNTHRPIYSNASILFDVQLERYNDRINGSIKRIFHHYTFNEEDPSMGSQQPSMQTVKTDIKIPLIQTDCALYTKKIKIEANDKIRLFIQRLTQAIEQ
ncbi:MAG: hypothetical protein MUE33_02305 [Cytophagaceae bacterium]|jgi:hypothetical protein|nr:hypothetical protein [Cytophagaceae bacterium]